MFADVGGGGGGGKEDLADGESFQEVTGERESNAAPLVDG
jgi:hypothetical protein